MHDLAFPCPACGERSHRFDRFCPSCGVALRTVTPGGLVPPSPITPLGYRVRRPSPWRRLRRALGGR